MCVVDRFQNIYSHNAWNGRSHEEKLFVKSSFVKLILEMEFGCGFFQFDKPSEKLDEMA